jgi:methionine-rich copper-binding protein CopC
MKKMKKLLGFLSIVILSGACGQAANIHLVTSTPANGSVTDTPPSAFVLQFSESVQLHSLYLKRADEKRGNSVGNLPHSDATTFMIPAPSLTPGGYVLEWEIFTHNSMSLRGSVRFTVSGGELKSTLPPARQ